MSPVGAQVPHYQSGIQATHPQPGHLPRLDVQVPRSSRAWFSFKFSARVQCNYVVNCVGPKEATQFPRKILPDAEQQVRDANWPGHARDPQDKSEDSRNAYMPRPGA